VSARDAAPRVGVLVFPGTNSEDETVRACRAVGLDARLVRHGASRDEAAAYAGYVLPGGFAYEDRVRAGAIAAHDALVAVVREGARAGKPVLGICNGAQILMEAGLVPDLDGSARPSAGFTRNASGRFRSSRVRVKLTIPPSRCVVTAALPAEIVLPMWASHGEGRLAAHDDVLEAMRRNGHVAFAYADRDGDVREGCTPNGSALGAAGVVNRAGNVLAIMPHPERDAWTFQHRSDPARRAAVRNPDAFLAPSGGIALIRGLAGALGVAPDAALAEAAR